MSLAVLTGSPAVQRLWRNERTACKDYGTASDPTRPTTFDLCVWPVSLKVLRDWFVQDVLTVEEFEHLVELVLRRRG